MPYFVTKISEDPDGEKVEIPLKGTTTEDWLNTVDAAENFAEVHAKHLRVEVQPFGLSAWGFVRDNGTKVTYKATAKEDHG